MLACSAPAAPTGGGAAAGARHAAPAAHAHPRDYVAEARASFTPENRAYQLRRVVLSLLSPLAGIAAGLLLLFTGLAQRFRDIARARARGHWGRVLVFFALYSLAMFVLLLPLAWYEEFALEHRFGFSNQTLAGWTADQLKALAFQVVSVGVVPLLALAWRAVEASPRRWWLWLSLGTLPVAAASVLLQPLVFDPLFNTFTPLHDRALGTEILALGARAGVPARDVYQVDMSSRTNKINAYVSGWGSSQRIVLWDTALKDLSKDEILFLMGHEMGHYVLGHIWRGLLLVSAGAFVAFWLVAWLVHASLRVFGLRWGVHEAGDLAAIPLLVAMLSLVSWLAAPISNAVSRRVEHEADVFALELTHDNDAGARAYLKLAQGNRSDPEPAAWVKLVLYTHPPLADRIRFALEYRPWERGEPNRFYHGN
ncbi:MAG TPA: M48 family metallopeptidase [Candidatus Eisenbacteria bacterium]